jgi:dienelactone hydrolase
MMRVLVVIMITLMTFTARAVEKGDFVLQPSLNLGGYGGYPGYGGFGLGATLNADFAVHNYISVGPFIGYNVKSESKDNYKYSRLGIGARGVFHWWQLLDDKVAKDLKADKIDFYVPVFVGGYLSSARFDGNKKDDYDNRNGVLAGVGIGFRYYFQQNIGISLEWGRQEMSYAKIGVAIKM